MYAVPFLKRVAPSVVLYSPVLTCELLRFFLRVINLFNGIELLVLQAIVLASPIIDLLRADT